VAGTAFHCYNGDVSAQSTVKTAYPAKDVWFTECSGTVGSGFAGDLVWNSHTCSSARPATGRAVFRCGSLALDQGSGPTNGGCMGCRGVVTIDSSTLPATITYTSNTIRSDSWRKFVVPERTHRFQQPGSGGIEDVAFANLTARWFYSC